MWPSCIGVDTSVAPIAAVAFLPALTHSSRHAPTSAAGRLSMSGCGSQTRTLLATWSSSRHIRSGSMRNVGAAAAASHAFITFEVGVLPSLITRSGPCWSDQPARSRAS